MIEPSGEDHAPGDRVAEKYLLVRLLEMGGMGAVWVAHHLGLDVHVAIKFIRADAYSKVAAERLLHEARAAARLDHPAIVHVSDVGRTAQGETYLVMELLDGEALCDVLGREGRLDPETAVRVLLPVCGALTAMHAKGIVHRDIKPENIFLSCDDGGRWQPKLIDFGLARVPDSGARLTQRGYVVGTPIYMSPERMEGEEADGRDDVWSLAVVLYETITGAVPFEDSPNPALRRQRAPRSILDHGVGDDELWAIVERGLTRKGTRWDSAQDLGRVLAAWLWQRGSADDVTGVSLRQSWIGDDDVRRLTAPRASLVTTARFAAPFRTRTASMTAPTLEAPVAPAGLRRFPSSAAPTMEVPVDPPSSRRPPSQAASAPPAASPPPRAELASSQSSMPPPSSRSLSYPSPRSAPWSPAEQHRTAPPAPSGRRAGVLVLTAVGASLLTGAVFALARSRNVEGAPGSSATSAASPASVASPSLVPAATPSATESALPPSSATVPSTRPPRLRPTTAPLPRHPTDDLKDPFRR